MSETFVFNATGYSPLVTELLREPRLPALGSGRENRSAVTPLKQLSVETLFAGHKLADSNHAQACVSALWLWHDYLDESHTISQSLETAEGSYWHGIMHRREPDYFNAKYWFRRVGQHPIFPSLAKQAQQLARQHTLDSPAAFLLSKSTWDPFQFIDLCEAIAHGKSRCESVAQEIAKLEWQWLFDYCWKQAIR